MNLQKFEFPTVRGLDLAFSTFETNPVLLAEARKRGFYGGNTPANKLFSDLFFNGGKITFKKDLPEEYKTNATRYLKAFMRSFEPKQEEKEAICALILSEIADI